MLRIWTGPCAALALLGAPSLLAADRPLQLMLPPGATVSTPLAVAPQQIRVLELDSQGEQVSISLFDGDHLLRQLTLPENNRLALRGQPGQPLQLRARSEAPAQLNLKIGAALPSPSPAQPAAEQPASPRLRALQTALESGDTDALNTFWQHMTAHGGPLVEPMADGRQRVTFVVRSPAAAGEVRLFWPAPGINSRQLALLPGSDLRYLSIEVPAGTRASYRLASGLPPMNDQPRAVLRQVLQDLAAADPLNPARWQPDPAAPAQSVLSLPGARPYDWHQPRSDVPKGTVQRLRYHSKRLGNQRQLTLYTPAGKQHDALPLLTLFDEQAYTLEVPTPTLLDNLIAAGRIPPMAAVLVGNPDRASRATELPGNPDFADFLAMELLPWLQTRLPISCAAEDRILAGSSFGGLAAAYVAMRHPQRFGKVLSQSGSFWWSPEGEPPQWLVRQYAEHQRLPLRFYLDAGLLEEPGAEGILGSTRALYEVLQGKGYPVDYQEFAGGHDYLLWRDTLVDGLTALTSDSRGASQSRYCCRRLSCSLAR
ncbi:enterochelin esterase [Halopseudomonas maritima]|uniref:enterochelin esterase n=1 Tax=Halopseudomonas maritima TaxID=2918528 RepID=UPI001EEACEF9|nr:enterochelin esterase [Halopseudomonas maritima]UJJ32691.1 enterochelin esterase [Halopseudomonas maritima]